MKLESVLAGGVALYDARGDLPRAKPYPGRRRPIDRCVVHHSGALGRPGLEGMQSSARFVIERRGWPGFAYHFFVPYGAMLDRDGRLMILRGNGDHERTNHTTGSNERGIGVCLQGDLTESGPSHAQIECLEAFLPWAIERYALPIPEGLTWHAEAGKKQTCPGAPAVAWLSAYREAA